MHRNALKNFYAKSKLQNVSFAFNVLPPAGQCDPFSRKKIEIFENFTKFSRLITFHQITRQVESCDDTGNCELAFCFLPNFSFKSFLLRNSWVLREEEVIIIHEGKVLTSLMTYVNGLLPAILILALSSESSGILICHNPINFVPDGHYLIARIVFLLSLQIDTYFGT